MPRHARHRNILAFAAAAVAVLSAAASIRAEEARSIEFHIGEVPAASGDWRIDSAWFEGMVDPDSCTDWYSDLASPTAWTWRNNGRNVTPFALTIAFNKTGGSDVSTQSAIRCIAVDPANMGEADPVVTVNLQPCRIAPDRPQLRIAEIAQAGVKVKRIGGQPDCS